MKLTAVIVQKLLEREETAERQSASSHPPKAPQVHSDMVRMKQEVCYGKEHARLHIWARPGFSGLEELVASGGQHLVGSAPRGSQEGRAQELMDKLEGKTRQQS